MHLFAMVSNDQMVLIMAGSEEHTWITYFDTFSWGRSSFGSCLSVWEMFVGVGRRMCRRGDVERE